jgi:hypothetical protein
MPRVNKRNNKKPASPEPSDESDSISEAHNGEEGKKIPSLNQLFG